MDSSNADRLLHTMLDLSGLAEDRKNAPLSKADEKVRQTLQAEFDRLMVIRDDLFDELDRFPRNARAEAKRKQLDQFICRLGKTLNETP